MRKHRHMPQFTKKAFFADDNPVMYLGRRPHGLMARVEPMPSAQASADKRRLLYRNGIKAIAKPPRAKHKKRDEPIFPGKGTYRPFDSYRGFRRNQQFGRKAVGNTKHGVSDVEP